MPIDFNIYKTVWTSMYNQHVHVKTCKLLLSQESEWVYPVSITQMYCCKQQFNGSFKSGFYSSFPVLRYLKSISMQHWIQDQLLPFPYLAENAPSAFRIDKYINYQGSQDVILAIWNSQKACIKIKKEIK